jgi:hypothetical protein
MLKFFTISGLLIAFLLLQDPQPDKSSLLLQGTLNCKSGAVSITLGPSPLGSTEENVPSLSTARERLLKAGYSEAGVAKLSEILTAVCKQEFGSEFGQAVEPERDHNVLVRAQANPSNVNAAPGSLVVLRKREQIVSFAVLRDTAGVVEYNESGRPTTLAPAERVAGFVMSKGEADCKPISNVCVKCSDGKIICSTPALKN